MSGAEWSYDATRDAVLAKIKSSKRAERKDVFEAILAGKSFAQPGSRDHTLQRVASWLAFYCCDGDPEAITDLLVPSLEAMEAESPTDFISYEDALSKVVRAQNDARAKELIRRDTEARIMSRVFGKTSAPTPEAAPVATAEGKGTVTLEAPTAPGIAPPTASQVPRGVIDRSAVVPGEVSIGHPASGVKRRLPWERDGK